MLPFFSVKTKQNKQISQEIKRNHIKMKRGSVTYSVQNDTSK